MNGGKWVKTNKSYSDFLRGVHQDMVSMFLSIHDEVDLAIDKQVRNPIMVKIAQIAENKKIFDKFGFRYINFYFDMEYDKYSSFTSASVFSPYQYYLDSLKQSDSNVKQSDSNVKQSDSKNLTILVSVSPEKINEKLLESLSNLAEGDCSLVIETGGNKFSNGKSIDIVDFTNKFNNILTYQILKN